MEIVPYLAGIVHAYFFSTLLLNAWYLWRQKSPKPQLLHPPGVSVLIPARNEASNLQRLIPSLLQQQYPDFDIWVYDDQSTDETWAVLNTFQDFRLNLVKGIDLPVGWVGKVHGLYQLSQKADKEIYLFLDADTHLQHEHALMDWVKHFQSLAQPAYLSAFPDLKGGGKVLISLVPFAILGALPLWLMKLPFKSLSMLNGQFWMIRNAVYHHFEPHLHLKNAVLEDVEIGRYLKSKGVMPYLADFSDSLSVWMYEDLKGAWQGFRKNAYLIMGANPIVFLVVWIGFIGTFLLAPLYLLPLLISTYIIKGFIDRLGQFPIWISLLTPIVFCMGAVLALHSALSHWTGRVSWKGREVG